MSEFINVLPQEETIIRAMETFCISTLNDPKESSPEAIRILPDILDTLCRYYHDDYRAAQSRFHEEITRNPPPRRKVEKIKRKGQL